MTNSLFFWLDSNNKVSKSWYSRTNHIRHWQKVNGHTQCFGISGKFRNKVGNENIITPRNCGEDNCSFRIACEGLHEKNPFSSAKLREVSIEILSKVYFVTKNIERQDTSTFQDRIEKLITDWTQDTPQIALLGAFSSGKSTFINKILNTDVLPVKRTPTTGVVTIIRYGQKPFATVYFRKKITIGLLAADKQHIDKDALATLYSWISEPEKFGVKNVFELLGTEFKSINIESLKLELKKLFKFTKSNSIKSNAKSARLVKKLMRKITGHAIGIEQFTRNFKIEFAECHPIHLELDKKEDAEKFKVYLHEYKKAIRVEKAICELPHKDLKIFNLLDTSGLCSPHTFHTSITEELLSRRPDKILILLDSRNLGGTTNREAVIVLKQFLSSPPELRKVTFGLTFWDLLLRNYMEGDREPELSFFNHNDRQTAMDEKVKDIRLQLRKLIEESLGFKCETNPTSYILALGSNVHDDLKRGMELLCKELLNECREWIGVKMWTERWLSNKDIGSRLIEMAKKKASTIKKDIKKNDSDRSVDDEMSRLNKQEQTINSTFTKMKQEILEQLKSMQPLALSEINMLDSKSQIRKYMNSGYTKIVKNILDSVKTCSENQVKSLLELVGKNENAVLLKSDYVVDFDRRLLGLDESVKEETEKNITGPVYFLKGIWDLFLGSIKEWNATHRAAARDILKREIVNTIDITQTVIIKRNQRLIPLKSQIISRIREQKKQIEKRKRNKMDLLRDLKRRLSEVEGVYERCEKLEKEIKNNTNYINSANERIHLSKREDFKVYLIDVKDENYYFKHGRREGTLILFSPPESEWKEIVLETSKDKIVYYPQKTNSPFWIKFKKNNNNTIQFIPSCPLSRIELQLTTMTAKLIKKQDIHC